MAQIVIVMGVSGCGKSTIGSALAAQLGWQFTDADAHHPPANIAKMRDGLALNDDDRKPWLATLNQILKQSVQRHEPRVLACSALKQSYRDQLTAGIENQVQFVHLKGSFELIENRLKARQHEYMPSSLLQSQFALLEPPLNAIEINIDRTAESIVAQLKTQIIL
jgi:carbohydrate kinase (thermoresistant glucokinase family)